MTGATPAPEPSPAAGRRPEYLIALFVAVGWAAVVFAVFGLMAVAFDREPVPSGVSPYYGLLALAVAGVVVWLAVARGAVAPGPWLPALTAAAGVYLVLVLSGGVDGFRLAASQATSPFVVVAAVLAAVAVVTARAGIRSWRTRVGD